MQLPEVEKFNQLLEELAGVFGKKFDDKLEGRYFEALKDLPFATVERCAREHIKHGKYFPKPRDLRPKREREASDSDERGPRGKFPELYSAEWWTERTKVLRTMSAKRPTEKALQSLNEATFGDDATPELLKQAAECYARAWPEADYSAIPEAWR